MSKIRHEEVIHFKESEVSVEFPKESGHGVKGYPACSYSAGETYPSDECRRLAL
jgi:hypothetical protein